MANITSSIARSVTVVRAEETDKARLRTQLSKLDETSRNKMEAHLSDPVTEIYCVYQNDDSDPWGCVVTSEYNKMPHAMEISLLYPETIEDAVLFKEILEQIVNFLSDNHNVNYIILKIRESLKTMASAAESLGFMKDGIFISNQFLAGEFTFYSVYQYKLV